MAGYKYEVNDKFQIEPAALIKFVRAAPMQLDFSLKMIFQNSFWIAGSYRLSDAVVAMAGFQLNQNLSLAYAYDMTLTDLSNYSSGSLEITLGLTIDKRRDNDDDGIPDKEDDCPNEPGTKSNKGCPDKHKGDSEEVLDSDGDGIVDTKDDCTNIPGNRANNGCPFGDRDKDGIRDDIDKCPDIPGVADNIGCPIHDSDLDGITDEKDRCPDLPGSLSTEGCPGEDSDRDGIIDEADSIKNHYLIGQPLNINVSFYSFPHS